MTIQMTKILSVLMALFFSTIVCAASEYEEVGYEDLVRQISSKKRTIEDRRQPHPFDQVMIHTGFSYVNSFTVMDIRDHESQKYQNESSCLWESIFSLRIGTPKPASEILDLRTTAHRKSC